MGLTIYFDSGINVTHKSTALLEYIAIHVEYKIKCFSLS